METRKRILLSGDWKFAMDPLHQAINFCGGWYDYDLPDTVKLPGTTDINRMGVEMKVKDVDHPNSRYEAAAQEPLCEWLRQGKLSHNEFLSAEYPIENIQQALEASRAGQTIKTLLRF